jgi:hypothetical protein
VFLFSWCKSFSGCCKLGIRTFNYGAFRNCHILQCKLLIV